MKPKELLDIAIQPGHPLWDTAYNELKQYIEKEPEFYLDWIEDKKHAFIKIWSDGSMSMGLRDVETDIKKYIPLSNVLKGLAYSMFKLIDWHK